MPLKTSTGKNLRDFNLVSMLCDSSGNPITRQNKATLYPRYTDNSTAASKTMSASGDYADPTNHSNNSGWSYDFYLSQMPPTPSGWYNYTYQTTHGMRGGSSSPNNGTMLNDHGNMVSLYMDIHIGDGPHPGVGTNYAHISLLINQYGAYHQWHHGGPSPVYTTPRTMFEALASGNENLKIAGQNYSTQLYSQIFSMGEMQNFSQSGGKFLRMINHGGGASNKSRITVCGGQLIIHGRSGSNNAADA